MFNSMKGRPVQGRIYQEKEPPQFIALFQPMVLFKGGLSSSYKSYIAEKGLTDETYSPDNASIIRISGTALHNNKAVHLDRYPDCGFRQPKSGVVLSCLDCFLRDGALYSFEYGVNPTVFLAKVRGGTCTTATSDDADAVVHRAMYLLQSGFGNYDVFQNNCEDFALYCKTGILTVDKLGIGRSGQASSVIGAPLAALLSSPLKLLIPSPVGIATVTAGMYCMSRYATDIGVRTDVVKVAVEDLAVNLSWMDGLQEAFKKNEASSSNSNKQFRCLHMGVLSLDTHGNNT